jgi:hypothetical protein
VTDEMKVRLLERLDRSGGPDSCWPYTLGATTRSGHRQMWWLGSMRLVHRLAYEAFVGPIPSSLCVCHHCDNPPCCNPAHLFVGTVADNNADRDRKGRGVIPRGEAVRRRPAGPTKHGTLSAYIHRKCRCKACVGANSEYRRRNRKVEWPKIGERA